MARTCFTATTAMARLQMLPKRQAWGATELGTTFHSAATFFDYDRDGRLDLYVGGYANFLPDSQRACDIGHGVMNPCWPMVYPGSSDVLYHNSGDGTFTDVTRAEKIYQPNGFNLAVGAGDYDNDGWPDLFVANDGADAYLYHNNHDGTFTNVATTSGMAFTQDGNAMGGMCIALGDYKNDGNLDLLITDFQLASDHLWHNNGKGFSISWIIRLELPGPRSRCSALAGASLTMTMTDGWTSLSPTEAPGPISKRFRPRSATGRSTRPFTTSMMATSSRYQKSRGVDLHSRSLVVEWRSPTLTTTVTLT